MAYDQTPPAAGTLDQRSQLEQTGSFFSVSRVRDECSPFSRSEQNGQATSPTRDRNGDDADSVAPVLEGEERETLHETKKVR